MKKIIKLMIVLTMTLILQYFIADSSCVNALTSAGSEQLEEGIYKIVLATAPKQSLTVDGGKTWNGANVHIWEYVNAPQQQFRIKYDSNGYCEIIPINSNKRLDVVGWGNGANVDQWEYNGGNDNQKWIIKKSSRGNYNIISKRKNLYLDAYQSKTYNGNNIEVYQKSGGNGQEFKLELIKSDKGEKIEAKKTVEEGTYKIVMATSTNQSLTVDGGKTGNGANVHLWQYVNSKQQQFNLVYDGKGYYEIIPIHSGKRLDVAGWGNEANVDQWQQNGGNDNQKWIIYKNSKGNYNIISKRQKLYLDAYRSKTTNGTNIEVYEKSGGNGQEFKLEKISNKSEKTVSAGTYKLEVQANKNMVVEASASNTSNNGKLQIWQDYNVRGQKVKLEYENGYYKISLCHSGKYLTVKDKKIASGTEVVQYEWYNGDNQKWIIRDNGNGSVGIIPLSNYGLTLDIKGAIQNGSTLELYNNEKNVKQRFILTKTAISVNINTTKYPGVAESLDKVAAAHPNWQFEILYTNLDFYTAVKGEYEYANKRGNLVYTPTYNGNWIASNPYISGVWASASYNGIAYFMDTRNFLNDVDIFQFVDLGSYSSSGATLSSIQYQVNGTFLEKNAGDIKNACQNKNINPYYVIARLFQEQGRNGSATINMDGGDGKKYQNPFNIGAVVGNDVATALAYAKKEGWDTMQKGLEGGIKILKSNYIDKKQNTLYLNKFNVNPVSSSALYGHQYMQNLSAAYSEARTFRSAYVSTGTLNNKIKFVIPVFENMPKSPASKPTGSNGSQTVSGEKVIVKTNDGSGVKLRKGPGTTYDTIAHLSDGTVGIRTVKGKTTANGFVWDEVVFGNGIKGYVATNYLQKVN